MNDLCWCFVNLWNLLTGRMWIVQRYIGIELADSYEIVQGK